MEHRIKNFYPLSVDEIEQVFAAIPTTVTSLNLSGNTLCLTGTELAQAFAAIPRSVRTIIFDKLDFENCISKELFALATALPLGVNIESTQPLQGLLKINKLKRYIVQNVKRRYEAVLTATLLPKDLVISMLTYETGGDYNHLKALIDSTVLSVTEVSCLFIGYNAFAGFVMSAFGSGLIFGLAPSAFASAASFLGLALLNPIITVGIVASAMALVFATISYIACKGLGYEHLPSLFVALTTSVFASAASFLSVRFS